MWIRNTVFGYEGDITHELNSIAKTMWFWCNTRCIHISAAYVTGKDNCKADEESRKENQGTVWSLHIDTFKTVYEMYLDLSVDLFALHLNYKLDKYVCRRPEPN